MKRLLALIVILGVAVAMVTFGRPSTVISVGTIAITVPATVTAGTAATVAVEAPSAPDDVAVDLIVISPYATDVIPGRIEDGVATIRLPGHMTTAAGSVSVIAVIGDRSQQAAFDVVPAVAHDPLLALVGARSIVADGKDTAMVVAIPEDAFGNPLPDGTSVAVTVRRPAGNVDRQTVAVRHTVAWAWVASQTTAGRSAVSMTAAGARGPAAPLLEVPGIPEPFDLELLPRAPLDADGTSRVAVRTGVLADAYGNVLLDGTAVTFAVAGDTRCLIEAEVIDGRATAYVPTPAAPGSVVVTATAVGTAGRPLTVAFAPSVGSLPAAAAWSDGTLRVDAGPILGPVGALVPDGTEVTIAVDDAGMVSALTVDGRIGVAIELPEVPSRVAITAAGNTVEVAT